MSFPTTHWTLLAQATLHGDGPAGEALAEFCRRYRLPIVQFMQRKGVPAFEAEDAAHDFLMHVIEKSALRRADAARGRFRSFLCGAVARFLGDARDRDAALKRGGGVAPLSLDADDGINSAVSAPPPDAEAFDREWGFGLLALALAALEAEFIKRGRAADFALLRPYVPGSTEPPSYEESAARMGLSLGAFKTEVHRMRQRFRALVREEVAATVSSPEEIEAEITYLSRVILAGSP